MNREPHAVSSKLLGHVAHRRRRAGVDAVRDEHDGVVALAAGSLELFRGLLQRVSDGSVALGFQSIKAVFQPGLVDPPDRRQYGNILATTIFIIRRIRLLGAIRDGADKGAVRKLIDELVRRVLGRLHFRWAALAFWIRHGERGVHNKRHLGLFIARRSQV